MRTASSSSHARRINDHDAGAEPREPSEVGGVERQQMRYSIDMADRHETSVMDLFADDAKRADKSLPRGANVRRFG
jgi:hypothetical protein